MEEGLPCVVLHAVLLIASRSRVRQRAVAPQSKRPQGQQRRAAECLSWERQPNVPVRKATHLQGKTPLPNDSNLRMAAASL